MQTEIRIRARNQTSDSCPARSGQTLALRVPVETSLWSAENLGGVERLYAQGLRGQWDPETALDWSLPVTFGAPLPPDAGLAGFLASPLGRAGAELWTRFRWEFQVWLVSQFLYGEQAALVGAARIAESIRGLEEKKIAAVQTMDEARHVDVFARYLAHDDAMRPFPVSAPFAGLVKNALADSRLDFVLLGIHVLVEGVALAAFRMAETTLHDPLIRSIVGLVQRDESRHIAFGVLGLRNLLAHSTAAERRERQEFLAAAAELTVRRFLLEDVWERVGIDPKDGAAFAAADEVMSAYRRTIFAKVVGIIRGFGLLEGPLLRDLTALGLVRRE